MTDRDEIQELMARYADAIDHRRYDDLAACFAADASAQYAAMPEPIVGNKTIASFMKTVLDRLDVTTHQFTNFIIEINGDTARMRANVIAQHVRNNTPGGDKYLAGARYDAQMKKADGKWKLTKVRGLSVWNEGNKAVMAP